jgi:HEPN domain-containing protein
MAERSKDWFVQAERDLEQAKSSQKEGRHEWACFAAQQSAEKAVKALHLFLKQEAWGHVVARLLNELPTTVFFHFHFLLLVRNQPGNVLEEH